MSGGRYDYAYSKLDDFVDLFARSCRGNPLREAFRKHLVGVMSAMRAIEWNDSGDGDDREREYIESCIGPHAEHEAAIEQLKEAIEVAQDVIKRSDSKR